MDLATKQERRLLGINLTIGLLIWIAVIAGTFGIALLYILAALIVYLFTQSALISHLKGNAVQITTEQFPDLDLKLKNACAKLQMPVPEAYIMMGNGVLNAFATKFLRRRYVVLLSDVVDAFENEADSGALDFYIGHELGHLHRNHLLWWPILLPVSIFPLLIPAYRRACESTCDQYGKFCSPTTDDAIRGLALLAAGSKRWKTLSTLSFVNQSRETGGFWMSFHEITGSYPWLSKRMLALQSPVGSPAANVPARHPMAWFLGLFCPGFLPGSLLPLLFLYFAIIAVAVAIPTFKKFQEKAKEAQTKLNSTWINVETARTMQLPEGFQVVKAEGMSDSILGAFSTNQDLMFEQILFERSVDPLPIVDYANALHRSKQSLPSASELSAPLMRPVKGIEVYEFTFKTESEGVMFKNTTHSWSHNGHEFWQLVSTARFDDTTTQGDSEKLLHALIENTKP